MRKLFLLLLLVTGLGLAACNGPPDPNDPMGPGGMMPDNPPMNGTPLRK